MKQIGNPDAWELNPNPSVRVGGGDINDINKA
jgi:hypothetical protein